MPLAYTDDSPSEVVAQLIVDLGLGSAVLTTDWAVFATGEPDLPDNAITVYDTTPFMDGRTHDGNLQGMPGIQVRVRARDPRNGWRKAKNIEYQLSLVYQRPVHRNTRTYDVHALNGFGGVLVLGKESPTSKRNLFTINCFVNFIQR